MLTWPEITQEQKDRAGWYAIHARNDWLLRFCRTVYFQTHISPDQAKILGRSLGPRQSKRGARSATAVPMQVLQLPPENTEGALSFDEATCNMKLVTYALPEPDTPEAFLASLTLQRAKAAPKNGKQVWSRDDLALPM